MGKGSKYNILTEVELVTILNKCFGLLPPTSNKIVHHLIYYLYVMILIVVAWSSHYLKTDCHLPEYHEGFVTVTNAIGISWLAVFLAYALRTRHENTLKRARSVIKEVDGFLNSQELDALSGSSYWNVMYVKCLLFVLHPIPVVRLLLQMFPFQIQCDTTMIALFFIANISFVIVILDLELRQFTSVVRGIGQRFVLLTNHISTLTTLDDYDQRSLETTIDMNDTLLQAAKIMNKGYSPALVSIICTMFIGTVTAVTTVSTRLYRFDGLPEGTEEILRPSIYLVAWVWLLLDCTLAPQQCEIEAKKFKSALYSRMMEHMTPNVFVVTYLGRKCELKFDAWGLLILNNTFIQTMLTSVCAYVVVLLQTADMFNKVYGAVAGVNAFEISLASERPPRPGDE